MKNIIDLNAEIEKISKPEIYFHKDYQTFSIFDTWVIEADSKYFSEWQKRIIEKINNIADLDSASKVKFIKVFHQDVLQKYKDITKFDNENLEELKSTFSGQYTTPNSMNKPKKSCSELSSYVKEDWYAPDFIRYHNTVQLLGTLFYSDDYFLALEDPEYTIYDIKCQLEELILEKIEMGELTIPEFESNREKIEVLYSFIELSFYFGNIKILLKNIAEHLDTYVNLIKKLENFEEDKLTLEDIYDNDPTNIKLEYRINKMQIAFFYKVLHDSGILFVDNKNQKLPYTNLKKYIDKANIYYLENKKVEKIVNINKEFSKIKSNEYKNQEIKLLDLITSKLNTRKEALLADKEEGIL